MMSDQQTVKKAATAASVYLEMRGFTILERNWQRPRSSIDIIASKEGVLSFIEVDYYPDDNEYGPTDMISSTKLMKLQRSAWAYIDETKWTRKFMISSVVISGTNFSILSFNENVL